MLYQIKFMKQQWGKVVIMARDQLCSFLWAHIVAQKEVSAKLVFLAHSWEQGQNDPDLKVQLVKWVFP